MTKLLLILLLVIGCNENTIADDVNYDHCDELTTYYEECAEIESNCDDVNGTFTQDIINDTDTPGDDSATVYCCCEY